MNIPIIVVCYNNYSYIENTLRYIFKINKEYYNNIIILDNCSDDENTIKYLKNITNVKIIKNNHNNGPFISEFNNTDVYNKMPDKFILTDPDVQFNENMPCNFIEIFSELSDKYKCHKIGIDISELNKKCQNTYIYNNNKSYTIFEWEIEKENEKHDLYSASMYRTMCLINKNNINSNINIRISKVFTDKHLHCSSKSTGTNIYDDYLYINNNYLKINKNNEFFLIEKNKTDPNFWFWENKYTNWEKDTFDIFDKFLNKNKIFIDIGAWIGTTSMYGSRKSKYVFSVDADKKSIKDMILNMKNNCENNYTIINKAVYNTKTEIKFGKNLFLNNSKMNDSTSQIYDSSKVSDEYYTVSTITPQEILDHYNINPNEISLIKVDIEGGEEYIISELYDIHKKYNIPLYISFHYSWWKDKTLDRFYFLTTDQKNKIINDPFISILFER